MTASTTVRAGREATASHLRAQDFRHRAACRDSDPELFYPAAEYGPEHDAQVSAAKAVCARCPVRVECLTWALGALAYGIAGGLTEHERHQLRVGRNRRAERSRGGNRAPLLISHTNPQAGTRAEGHRG